MKDILAYRNTNDRYIPAMADQHRSTNGHLVLAPQHSDFSSTPEEAFIVTGPVVECKCSMGQSPTRGWSTTAAELTSLDSLQWRSIWASTNMLSWSPLITNYQHTITCTSTAGFNVLEHTEKVHLVNDSISAAYKHICNNSAWFMNSLYRPTLVHRDTQTHTGQHTSHWWNILHATMSFHFSLVHFSRLSILNTHRHAHIFILFWITDGHAQHMYLYFLSCN